MRVESGRVFSIIAHELRSPLGVIQGYVRMLRSRRAEDDPETRMLTAILDATGRISTVARHASELAVWADGAPAADATMLSVAALLQRVAQHETLLRPVTVTAEADAADVRISTSQSAPLAAAVAALVVWLQRNVPDQAISLAYANDLVVIRPASTDLAGPFSDEAAERARVRLFSAGGQGLALVLARAVLDHHGIGVGLIDSTVDVIVLRLPKD